MRRIQFVKIFSQPHPRQKQAGFLVRLVTQDMEKLEKPVVGLVLIAKLFSETLHPRHPFMRRLVYALFAAPHAVRAYWTLAFTLQKTINFDPNEACSSFDYL